MFKGNRLALNTQLLIYQYKEQFPFLECDDIARIFCIPETYIKTLFLKEFLIVPSKLNKK